MQASRQRELFPPSKEDTRLATIERLWGDHPKVTTAAKMFDEQGEREAREVALRQSDGSFLEFSSRLDLTEEHKNTSF